MFNINLLFIRKSTKNLQSLMITKLVVRYLIIKSWAKLKEQLVKFLVVLQKQPKTLQISVHKVLLILSSLSFSVQV